MNTRNAESLENYYRYEDEYRNMLGNLNDKNMDDEIFMLQKKIFIALSVNLKHHCLFLVTQLQTKPLLLFSNRRNLSLS